MIDPMNRREVLRAASALAWCAFSARATGGANVDDAGDQSCAVRTAEEVTQGIDLTGKTVLVTGCSSGIGRETLRVLVLRGAHIYGLAPTIEKAQKACAAVTGPDIKGKATAFACDHLDFPSIVNCANAVTKIGSPIDVLICNAGIILQRLEQVHGLEKDFVVNHLGHFILVNRLLGLVKAAPQGRIVVVGSSASHDLAPKSGIEFDNLSGERDYDSLKMYAHSKLANGLFTRELARRLSGTPTTANVLCPGLVDTPMNRNLVGTDYVPSNFDFSKAKSVAQGAATSCYVATSPRLSKVNGAYFSDCSMQTAESYNAHMSNDAMAARLWKVSEDLTRPYLLPIAA